MTQWLMMQRKLIKINVVLKFKLSTPYVMFVNLSHEQVIMWKAF